MPARIANRTVSPRIIFERIFLVGGDCALFSVIVCVSEDACLSKLCFSTLALYNQLVHEI